MANVAFLTEADAKHQNSYRDAIRDLDLIESASLFDPTGATLDETRSVCGAKAGRSYDSVAKLLAGGKPDMALVTMIGANAPPVIRELLAAGVHVMAEKPACTSAEAFGELVQTADANGAHLMLALANRLRPDVQEARRIVANGGIGHLYAVQATQVDDQARIQRQLDNPDWTFQKALAGGGHLSWLGIHTLDAVRYLTGDEIVEVSAYTPVVGGAPFDVEDLGLVNFRFASGAHGALFSGYLMDKKGHSSFTLYGAGGWLRINAAEQRVVEWHSPAPAMNGAHDRSFGYDERGGGYTVWVEQTLQACLGEREAPITAADGLQVLRIVHAAYESARSGKTVAVAAPGS